MKIVHVATNDVVGGASRAAYRIHSGLRKIGCDSTMFVAHRTSDDPAVVSLEFARLGVTGSRFRHPATREALNARGRCALIICLMDFEKVRPTTPTSFQ
jgi:hypothetical protein